MTAHSRLLRQLTEAVAALAEQGLSHALIGGLALAAHRVIRATQDVDLLIEGADAERADAALNDLGYRCLHRSADAATYARGDERVDLLYATRPIARRLLADAVAVAWDHGPLRVVSREGLIGFKLQGMVNDPRRTQDLEDIRALLRAHRAALDLEEVRGYFALFDRADLLERLLDEVA